MKKALKRMNGKTLGSVTVKKAAIENDGEIVSRKVVLRRKNETTKNKMQEKDKSLSQGNSSEEDYLISKKSFATGEQNIQTDKKHTENKRIHGRQALESNPEKNAAKLYKSHVQLKKMTKAKRTLCQSAEEENIPSILDHFIKSPDETSAKFKKEQTVGNRHRLSLSRKKFANKNNLQKSSSSLEQASSENNDSSDKESNRPELRNLNSKTAATFVLNTENDHLGENNPQKQSSVPKTPRCAIKMRRIYHIAPKVIDMSEDLDTEEARNKPEQKNNQRLVPIPKTPRCAVKIRRIQPKNGPSEGSAEISADRHKENLELDNINSVECNSEQDTSVPQMSPCLVKVRRISPATASANKSTTVKRKLLRTRKDLDITIPSSPKMRRIMDQRTTTSREICKSPDIFSDPEPTRESDIYAFHTQSSQSEHEDIAADIIQKMKEEGRVKVVKPRNQHDKKADRNAVNKAANWCNLRKNLTVAETITKKKKRGRPKNVTIAGTSPKQKARPPKINKSVISAKRKLGRSRKRSDVKAANQSNSDIAIDNDDYDDHFDMGQSIPDEYEPVQTIEAVKSHNRKSEGFSTLAQKVLKEQAAIMSPMKPSNIPQNKNLDRNQLLQMAKKFVNSPNVSHSTPNKPNSSSLPVGFRPIRQSPSKGASSPWRVDTENIPRLFYFSRTSDHLPSYSSDVIPSSQPSNDSAKRKDSSKNSTAMSPSRMLSDSLNISALQNISPIKSPRNNTLNISNIENISPVKPLSEKKKDNSAVLNANPRRGLPDRSPLKPINILNVVTLPNRIQTNQVKEAPKPPRGNKENITLQHDHMGNMNKTLTETLNNNTLKDASIASDFFGFSDNENIDEDDTSLQPVPKTSLPSKKRLHNKLVKLKRLLPPKPTRLSYETVRSIFNSPKKQKDIREMLSSTRANAEPAVNITSTSTIVDEDSSKDGMSSIANNEENSTIADADLHLFDDLTQPQLQLSFNASTHIRTYERPKRKTKRIRSFILFHSDSENEDEPPVTKTKRSKPDKNKKELKKFVSEFNSMCDEVDQYELIVEKDKSG